MKPTSERSTRTTSVVGALLPGNTSPTTKARVGSTGATVATFTKLLLVMVSKLLVWLGKVISKLLPALTTGALICTSVLLTRTGLPP